MLLGEALPQASGKTSAPIIQIIAPAANPSPNGSNFLMGACEEKAGTAINGWGRLEKMLQKHCFPRFSRPVNRTSPMAALPGSCARRSQA